MILERLETTLTWVPSSQKKSLFIEKYEPKTWDFDESFDEKHRKKSEKNKKSSA